MMRRKQSAIPVNQMMDESGIGISVEKLVIDDVRSVTGNAEASSRVYQQHNGHSFVVPDESNQAHRHDGHSFFLLEEGTIFIDIDFQTYTIKAPSVIYVHPDQVHHTITIDKVVVSSWAVDEANLNPDYLKLLADLTPTKPIQLSTDTYSVMSEAVALCLKFSQRQNDKLFHSFLKDSCNALVALVISQYLEQTKSATTPSRFDILTKSFKESVERKYRMVKRPAEYAQELNVSTSYLNECVKNTTGHSVSHYIQQRVILEAKRLLYHSNKSVKEIATELGYDDYPYFSRLFTKVTSLTALAFRSKSRD